MVSILGSSYPRFETAAISGRPPSRDQCLPLILNRLDPITEAFQLFRTFKGISGPHVVTLLEGTCAISVRGLYFSFDTFHNDVERSQYV